MIDESRELSYGEAIREGFVWLMENYNNVFTIGQGLWSPWYVGNSMTDLDKLFGKDRVLDTPVSEAATTGAAIGASLCGYRPIVIHPRIDFMLLAVDQIVNQAAKWRHMLGGQSSPSVTIRSIVNRGGEQGAQHSQALHSWFSHVPGLRVVMPASVADARDLLIASVLCDDPVLYIDDRWLYDRKAVLAPPKPISLEEIGPARISTGNDLTIVAASYSVLLAQDADKLLRIDGIASDVWDVRVLNPLKIEDIAVSVERTGRLCVIDGGWKNCGFAGEIIASVMERIDIRKLKARPLRITLPDAPAPTSRTLEDIYYPKVESIVSSIKSELVPLYSIAN